MLFNINIILENIHFINNKTALDGLRCLKIGLGLKYILKKIEYI